MERLQALIATIVNSPIFYLTFSYFYNLLLPIFSPIIGSIIQLFQEDLLITFSTFKFAITNCFLHAKIASSNTTI